MGVVRNKLSLTDKLDSKWLAFIAVGVGTFIVVLDHGAVNIALPTISSDFDTDLPSVQWVVLGYAFGISALLLPAGRIADIFDRKHVYSVGFALFGLGSVLAGSAPNLATLLLFKTFSSVGAAIIMANGTAILVSGFPANERGRALGAHMTFVGTGSICGPALGGILVGALGWRSVFFVNGMGAFLGAVVAAIALRASNPPIGELGGKRGPFDWLGAGLIAVALVLLLLAVTNGGHRVEWASPVIAIAFVLSGILLAGFIWRERNCAAPMLHMALFANPTFSLGALAAFIAFLSTSSIFLLLPFYLQEVLLYPPHTAGLILISSAACMAIMGPIAGRLTDQYGWKRLTVLGAGISAMGMLLLTRISSESGVMLVGIALVCHGLGGGMFHTANHTSVMASTESSRYGVASAFIHLNRNTASTIGQAVAVAVAVMTMSSMGFEPRLDTVTNAVGNEVAEAFTAGLNNVYYMATGLLMLVVILSGIQRDRALAPKSGGD